MPIPYNRIEVIVDQPDLPTWQTTWAGVDGCGSSTCYFGSVQQFSGPSPNSWDSYEPVSVRVSKNAHSFSGKRHGYPPFTYTPYHVTKTTTRQHLVRRLDGASGVVRFYQYGYNGKEGGSTCHRVITRVETEGPLHSIWNVVSHDYTQFPEYVVHGFDDAEISQALGSVQNEVTIEALNSYDLLTEIGEFKDTPRMLNSMSRDVLSILRGMRNRHGRDLMRRCAFTSPRQLLRSLNKAVRKLGEEWMAYRYGIMPIIYSCQDLMKTLDRGQSVETRKSKSVSPTDLGVSLPGSTSTFLRTRIEGNITIRGNIFQHFTSQDMARISSVGMNPLVTAWELIPYSFVIDWFLNAGDYIAAKTGQSWSSKKWACLSQRRQYTIVTEVHLPQQDVSCTMARKTCTGWYGALPPVPDPVILSNPEGYFPVKTVEIDGYSRGLFYVGDAHLGWNPSLNWRRLLDSGVMSLNLIRSLMRSFR